MKLAVLTSSRADYGIYLPLLKALEKDPFFDLRLLVFGTHLSRFHGYTIDEIYKDGFTIDHKVEHIQDSDTPAEIAESMLLASKKFSVIWEKEKYDLVLCLGDRYEMFAAVSAAAPFRISFAHIHGGETTLGAIDNEFRHCITIFSKLHFVATDAYGKRVAQIKGSDENIYVVGSLSLDNLASMTLMNQEEFRQKFSIDLNTPSLLVTFHPETASPQNNQYQAEELVKALNEFKDYQIIITMPNADAMGYTMRTVYHQFAETNPNVVLVENFGTLGYFSCMQMASLVIGNSSSGIIEAASFNKYVVNIGNRQEGRAVSSNVLNCAATTSSIIKSCKGALGKVTYKGENIYFKKNAADAIIVELKEWKG
jgi:GDP/UDP-N,N'-diacetylbacillosamine 2-epimerase (hydrolysing)